MHYTWSYQCVPFMRLESSVAKPEYGIGEDHVSGNRAESESLLIKSSYQALSQATHCYMALRDVEWRGKDANGSCCSSCGGTPPEATGDHPGHSSSCDFDHALRLLTEVLETLRDGLQPTPPATPPSEST